mmetsp:Transcript_11302/g.27636  ORF Transcript_11302/g.27636 Transcript_11302/m.27636 type:complete len:276 (-) Transcript_11302:1134-1961(-)
MLHEVVVLLLEIPHAHRPVRGGGDQPLLGRSELDARHRALVAFPGRHVRERTLVLQLPPNRLHQPHVVSALLQHTSLLLALHVDEFEVSFRVVHAIQRDVAVFVPDHEEGKGLHPLLQPPRQAGHRCGRLWFSFLDQNQIAVQPRVVVLLLSLLLQLLHALRVVVVIQPAVGGARPLRVRRLPQQLLVPLVLGRGNQSHEVVVERLGDRIPNVRILGLVLRDSRLVRVRNPCDSFPDVFLQFIFRVPHFCAAGFRRLLRRMFQGGSQGRDVVHHF